MLDHKFNCPKCNHEIKYRLFQLRAIIKCEECKKEYIVDKNKIVLVLEVLFLFFLAMSLKTFVFDANNIDNIFIELICIMAILILLNAGFDYLFTHLIKWDHYFSLLERSEVVPKRKKK